MAKELISLRLPEGVTKQRLEKKAKEHHIFVTQLIQESINLMVGFDVPFYRMIQDLAQGVERPEWMVIENLTLSWFACREAKREVWGAEETIIEEFVVMGNKALTGLGLFNRLKDRFIQEEEQERVDLLLREEEEEGIPLSDDDKAFLIKKRKGRTWLESKEFAQEQQERKEAEAQLTPKQREAARYSLEVTREVNKILREQGEEAADEYLRKIKTKGNRK